MQRLMTFFAATVLSVSASVATAASFNIIGSFGGGQLGFVNFDVDITNVFDADILDTTDGLTINSSTSSVVAGDPFPISGGYGYSYVLSEDTLRIGGLSDGVGSSNSNNTDFIFRIRDFTSSPFVDIVIDSDASISQSNEFPPEFSVTVTGVNPVPLPAAGWLFVIVLGGLGGLGLMKRCKRRVT